MFVPATWEARCGHVNCTGKVRSNWPAQTVEEDYPMADNIISDSTYNLLAILLSKLEGLEAYDTYLDDMDGDGRQLIEQIRRDDERHANLLRDALEKLIQQNGLK